MNSNDNVLERLRSNLFCRPSGDHPQDENLNFFMETLHSQKLSKKKEPSTLKFVDVQEIRDGIVVLKNGSLRAILAASSINFDLKSTDEQEAIIAQYQNFLNSLDFPAQIVITSRRLNIQPYLKLLEKYEAEQTNELLRLQISEYQNFIKNLTSVTNIMSKRFYIVAPFFPVEANKKGGIFDMLLSAFNPEKVVRHKREMLEVYKNQLFQRIDHIIAGLSGTQVRIAQLSTEDLVELLYNSYNPNLLSEDIVKDVSKLEMRI